MEPTVDCPLAKVLADRLREARDEVTRRWLDRIVARVSIDPDRIFPSRDLLDHIPLLVEGIADYMEDPADEIGADVPVIAKAIELGRMRHDQGFGAHEIMKEYELLGGVLFSFMIRTVETVEEDCTRSELLACGQRLFRAISVIQQITTAQYLRLADEEVREREERLRSFNRMVTHELKNRLAALQGAGAMLNEPGIRDDAQQRARFLSIIERNAAGLHGILEDLLSLTRLDGDNRQQRNVQLPEVVAEVGRQLREMARERAVEIRVPESVPDVEVDAAALELCLVNLVSNGIKYSDPAKPEHWVEVRAYPHDQEEIVIEVRDNGLGVPEDAREHLFERFYRAESVSSVEGTGLGLSIVQETVRSVGGRVWAEFDDADGAGSTFKIALPARRRADGEAAASAERGATEKTADAHVEPAAADPG